jgi:sugar phosphate isomerase/epimerase
MRLGFYANYTKETAQFAYTTGFKSLELSAWPNSSLDAEKTSPAAIKAIQDDLEKKGIEISALGYYPNYLDQDETEAKNAQAYLLKVFELAQRMDIGVVATFAGRNQSKSVEDNIPIFKEVFSRFCDAAEKRNINIAIENCPMVDVKSMQGTNIAFSPEVWDAMFSVVPSKALGLEIDPSHMVWLGIDYVKAVREYGDRIFHAHAKDMEIVRPVLSRVGIYGQALGKLNGFGHGWWRARTPGWGDVDWPAFITALIEVGYIGNIDIEHEDDVFAAPQFGKVESEADIVANYGTEQKGLQLGYNYLSLLVA